jgi:hypothetical protein
VEVEVEELLQQVEMLVLLLLAQQEQVVQVQQTVFQDHQ